MASNLGSLAPAIIGQILSFDDTSHLSLTLFRVGNKRLIEQLQQGVTYIELRNEGEFDVCYLPWILIDLPSLRHLIIDRTLKPSYDLNERSSIAQGRLLPITDRFRSIFIVQGLPKQMESIIFRFDRSMELFFPLDDVYPFTNPGRHFPDLKRLHLDHQPVWTKDYLLDLPSSITSLTITLPDYDLKESEQIIAHLPKSLLQLAIVCRDDAILSSIPFYELLPPELASLALLGSSTFLQSSSLSNPTTMTTASLSKLPRSLTSAFYRAKYVTFVKGSLILSAYGLEPPGCDAGISIAAWEPTTGGALPPYISALNILLRKEDKLNTIVAGIPTHLTSLNLQGNGFLEPKTIRALPRRLTRLSSNFKGLKGLEAEDFPTTLRSLNVVATETPFSASQLSLLPAIETLQYHSFLPLKSFNALPTSIKSLQVQLNELSDEPIPLPPKLLHFHLIGSDGHLYGQYSFVHKRTKVKKPKSVGLQSDLLPAPELLVLARTFRLSWLPEGLRTFIMSGFPVPLSDFINLPSRSTLTHLSLDLLYHDTLFSTANTSLAEAADLLLDSEFNSEISPGLIVHFLPSNLTHLSLSGHFDMPPRCWESLPPNIEHLTLLPSTPLKQQVLNYLPMKRIRGLALHLSELSDPQFERIPPRLRVFKIAGPTEPLSLSSNLASNPNLYLLPRHLLPPAVADQADAKRGELRVNLRDHSWGHKP